MAPNATEKRPRGRPRKDQTSGASGSGTAPGPPPAKRRPGRPKKTQAEPPRNGEPSPSPSASGSGSGSEESDGPRRKRRKPLVRRGHLSRKQEAHVQAMKDAVEDYAPEVQKRTVKVLEAKRKPLEEADLVAVLGPDGPFDPELERQWNESPEKTDLEGSYLRIMGLWKISLRLFRCSPMAIISPLRGLVHQPLSAAGTPTSELARVWGKPFCFKLAILLTQGVWGGKVANLVTAIQFAVICRTDDRRVWDGLNYDACPALKRLRIAMLKEGSGPLPVSIQQMHKQARIKARERDPNLAITDFSHFLRHLGQLIEVEKGNAEPPTQSQGLEVYGVSIHDLEKILSAISTFSRNGGYPEQMPPMMAYEGYLACRGTNDVPRGQEQLTKFYHREWMNQHKLIAQAIEEVPLPEDEDFNPGQEFSQEPASPQEPAPPQGPAPPTVPSLPSQKPAPPQGPAPSIAPSLPRSPSPDSLTVLLDLGVIEDPDSLMKPPQTLGRIMEDPIGGSLTTRRGMYLPVDKKYRSRRALRMNFRLP